MQVDVWSDIACPWCYVGKRRLEAAIAAYEGADPVNVTWHSFDSTRRRRLRMTPTPLRTSRSSTAAHRSRPPRCSKQLTELRIRRRTRPALRPLARRQHVRRAPGRPACTATRQARGDEGAADARLLHRRRDSRPTTPRCAGSRSRLACPPRRSTSCSPATSSPRTCAPTSTRPRSSASTLCRSSSSTAATPPRARNPRSTWQRSSSGRRPTPLSERATHRDTGAARVRSRQSDGKPECLNSRPCQSTTPTRGPHGGRHQYPRPRAAAQRAHRRHGASGFEHTLTPGASCSTADLLERQLDRPGRGRRGDAALADRLRTRRRDRRALGGDRGQPGVLHDHEAIHNRLHGHDGDGGELGRARAGRLRRACTHANAERFASR